MQARPLIERFIGFCGVAAIMTLSETALGNQIVDITINGKTFEMRIGDTGTAKSFLDSLPLALRFENYSTNERIAYLPSKLNSPEGGSHSPERGDVMYYAPWGNLAVFKSAYGGDGSLKYIGFIGNEAMKELENSGKSVVRIQRR